MVANRQHKGKVVNLVIAVEGHIAAAAARDDEFSERVFDWAADEWMAAQNVQT